MKLVIDASVAMKWYVEQPHTEAARRLAAGDDLLIAPELILSETASAFWKYVRAGQIGAENARAALSKLPERFDVLSPLFPLTEDAFEIAVSLNHPVYDCFYLALARRESAPLVTADKRLAAAAQALPDVEVRLLGG
jgi:predicted nucleic acid-binding protein